MRYSLVLLAVLVGGLLGCGDGVRRVPVQGQVKCKDGPVGNATISFLPMAGTKGEGGIGTSDKDGNYSLTTGSRRGDSGVAPGKYKVRLSRFVDRDGSVLPPDAKEAEHPHARESIPAPFSTPDSTLEVTVPEQGGKLYLEIPVKLLGKK